MDGALVIDKPAGITSHDVVAQVRRLLRERRIGHTGTLDPFATGVLVVLVGRATRLAQFLSGVEKEYQAVIRLGHATDTGDLTGERIPGTESASAGSWSSEQIETALESLRGEIDQVPPMYSAKKQGGVKLYELARQGKEVDRKPVRVCIHAFEAMRLTGNTTGELFKANLDGTFDFEVRVVCSAGTYVRTLAEDFGKRLQVGAHLAELRRTRVGDFEIQNAQTLEQLQVNFAKEGLGESLLPPDAALSRLRFVDVSAAELQRIRNGMSVQVSGTAWTDGERVRIRDETGSLIAVGEFNAAKGGIHPSVVIARE